MLNSEHLLNQKIGNKHKQFASFAFSESGAVLAEEAGSARIVDHVIGAEFDEPSSFGASSSEPAPVLGLNLKEYF